MNIKLTVELASLTAKVAARTLVDRWLRGPLVETWPARFETMFAVERAVVAASERRGIDWLRAAQAMSPPTPAQKKVTFERIEQGVVRGLWCRPRASEPARTIVYLHGGGYVIGSADAYRDLCARLAVMADAQVFAPDYRLAPEHRFPLGHDDCLAATRWVLSRENPELVCVVGDSAGGALTVDTFVQLRDAGDALPASGVLIAPWTDPWRTDGSVERFAAIDFGDAAVLTRWRDMYIAERDSRVAVIDADLRGLPPLLVQAGAVEVLVDQIDAFVARAKEHGTAVSYTRYPHMPHVFHTFAPIGLSEAHAAIDEIAQFVMLWSQ